MSCKRKTRKMDRWKKNRLRKYIESECIYWLENMQLFYQGTHGASWSRQYCQYDSSRPVAGSIKAVYTVN